MVGEKTSGKIWLVDFYASWCMPCQQLAPEWRKLAKKVDKKIVKVGQVDCVIEQELCGEQGVTSYPNIRLYPSEYRGALNYHTYQGWMRDSHHLLQWVQHFMPTVSKNLDMSNFEQQVLLNNNNDNKPWMIDFFAPWCGHCQVFSPTFESLASKFEGLVNFGKVDCQNNQYLCQIAGVRAYPTIRFYKSNSANWQAGEDIEQYDFNSLYNIIQAKLKAHMKTEL
jgi:DnaJ family protein C protein 10